MAINYAYNFAQIDPSTNMCIGVHSTSDYESYAALPNMVEIPVNDGEYLCKYYIDGEWYEDAAGTIPWQSELI